MRPELGEARVSSPERSGLHWRIDKPSGFPRPGVILDRDGVLVEFVDYLHRADETRLAPGAAELVTAVRNTGAAVSVATNQAGIARSLYSWSDYFSVEREIDRQLAQRGTALDGIAACALHPEFTEGWSERHASWRKPGPEMINLLIRELNIARERCWVIGDHLSDIGAAKAAGLPGAILVRTGWGRAHQAEASVLASSSFEVVVVDDLTQALPFLISRFAHPSPETKT
jgi:D-glycero-D-manno-heptose 1,7-bisphosphate phosphatase